MNIPLNARQLARITSLKGQAEAAQHAYNVALTLLFDGADIDGTTVAAETIQIDDGALVFTLKTTE